MSAYEGIFRAGDPLRTNFLNQCILNGSTDYVFECLVIDYNDRPHKKKAIVMYDLFCAPDSPYTLNCNELLGNNTRLHRQIEFYRQSSNMNVVQKVILKGLRSADRNIFDHLLPAVFRQEDNNMMERLRKEAVNVAPTPPEPWQLSMQLKWKTETKPKLVRAGFDCIRGT